MSWTHGSRNGHSKKAKREHTPAFQAQLSTVAIISGNKEKSRKTYGKVFLEDAWDKPITFQELPDADNGHEAAALRAFLAVAEEEVAATGGTEIADEDVGGTQAGG